MVLSRSKTRSLSPGYAPPTKPITVRHHKCSTHKCEGKKKRSLKMVIDVSNEVARIGCSEYLHKNYMFVADGVTSKRVLKWYKESYATVWELKDELIKEGAL